MSRWAGAGAEGTLFASSSDEAKQLLTGVHLRFNDRSLEAATDGHRLAVLQVDDALQVAAEGTDDDSTFAVTLPARSLREVERLMTGYRKIPSACFAIAARWCSWRRIRWSPAGHWKAPIPTTAS